jgi:hypothetical protein
MNAWIERVMNFENLGARILANGACNQKIWALEAFRGKTVFLGVSRAIMDFLEWLEGLGAKDRGSCEFCGFSGFFCGILEGLAWFRTYM